MVVEFSDFEVIKEVGSGAFATVYYGKKKDNKSIAIKKLITGKKEFSQGHYFFEFKREVCHINFSCFSFH